MIYSPFRRTIFTRTVISNYFHDDAGRNSGRLWPETIVAKIRLLRRSFLDFNQRQQISECLAFGTKVG